MREKRSRWPVIAAVAALVIVPVFVAITLLSHWLPPYDQSQDYAYAFPEPPARRVAVELTQTGFKLPASEEPWDTALLRLHVSATFVGKWLAPSIALQLPGASGVTQYFEPGASGVRYMNVSDLAPRARSGDTEIRLRGHHITWKLGAAELLLFNNGSARKPRVVVIAPHPDDAEIAAFGFYSRNDSRVITVTAGDSGPKRYDYMLPDDAEHFALKARLRVWDSVTVPYLGGVKAGHAINLGYFDGRLKDMFARPDEAVRARYVDTYDLNTFRQYNVAEFPHAKPPRPTWHGLVADLRTLFESMQPDIIVAPHPLLEAHPDHIFSGLAVLEALGSTRPDVKMYLYAIPAGDAVFPYGPATAVVGPVPWFDGAAPFSGVYSFPLDPSLQVLKLFALDAMHDVRRGPPSLETSWRDNYRRLSAAARTAAADLLGGDAHNFHRRAARPNELFFVYPGRDACALWRVAVNARGATTSSTCH